MNDPEPPLKYDANRLDPRVIPKGMTAAIRRRGFLPFFKFRPCRFLSISRGGIGVLVDDWSASTNTKVALKLTYHENDFVANGIIVHRGYRENAFKYGIIFTSVSYELDRLIDFFLHRLPQDHWDRQKQEHQKQQRRNQRFRLKDMYAGVRVSGFLGRRNTHKCLINDISKTGVSFFSPVSLCSKIPFKVKIELAVNAVPYQADGLVNHYRITEQGYCYGLELLAVSPGLSHAIEHLAATAGQASSMTFK